MRPVSHIYMHGYGHYDETYERIGTNWLIKHCKLTRLALSQNAEPKPIASP
jgi:hypothetical protein